MGPRVAYSTSISNQDFLQSAILPACNRLGHPAEPRVPAPGYVGDHGHIRMGAHQLFQKLRFLPAADQRLFAENDPSDFSPNKARQQLIVELGRRAYADNIHTIQRVSLQSRFQRGEKFCLNRRSAQILLLRNICVNGANQVKLRTFRIGKHMGGRMSS